MSDPKTKDKANRNKKQDETEKPSNGGSSRLKWLAFGLISILLLPTVITLTGKHRALLKLAQPKLEQAIEYKSITSHWWAPIEIVDLQVKDLAIASPDADASQIPLATISSITSVQPLWKLVLSGGNGAEFIITQPVVNVVVNGGRTNVEETVERLFGTSDSQGTGSAMSATIEDGVIRLLPADPKALTDESATFTSITGINGRLSTLNKSLSLPELSLIANVHQLSAKQQLAVQRKKDAQMATGTRVAATLNELSTDFPLLPFTEEQIAEFRTKSDQPDLKLHLGPSEKDGVQQLSVEARRVQMSQLQVLLQRWLPDSFFRGEVSCRIQGHVLGGDVTKGLAGRFQLLGEDIGWRNLTWAVGESVDLGSVSVQGAIALAEDGVLVNDLRMSSSVLELVGNGEVRQLAPDPAQTLQQAASNRTAAEQLVVAEAQAATAGQVRISGTLDLAALSRMLPRTLSLEEGVQCQSATLKFSARVQNKLPATTEVLTLTPTGNDFSWQFAAQSSPVEATRDGRSLKIDSLCRLDALGSLNIQGGTIDAVSLQGSFGKIAAEPLDSGYLVSGSINPERLWNDFQNLITVPRPGLRGEVELYALVQPTSNGIRLSRLNLKSPGLEVNSPLLTLYPNRTALQMCEGTLELQGDSAAVKTLIAPWHTASWLSDNSTIAAKLEADPRQQVNVNAVILSRNPVRPASLYKTISASPAASTQSSDQSTYLVIDQGKIDANLIADQRTGDFLVERCQLEIAGLQTQVRGTMGVREGLLTVNLTADTSYDLDVLSLRVLDPNGRISFSGRGREEFLITGSPSLWTPADLMQHQRGLTVDATAGCDANSVQMLQASGRIAWTGGQFYGTPIGAGTVVAELKNGLVRSEPIQCSFGGGELSIMPQLNLETNLLQLASGSRISNLNLTPELCREWIGYVAPVLADSATVDGSVSARVHQFQYAIDSPSSSTIQAVLTIHRGVASPGNSLAPLLQVLSVVSKSNLSNRQLEFPAQDVPVQVDRGMIVHDGLEMTLAGYSLRSAGGVGFDRRVQLVLDVPMEKGTAGQSTRSLRIPVYGTVDRPQLDTAGLLQNLGTQQIQNRVNDQLNNGLKNLFKKL